MKWKVATINYNQLYYRNETQTSLKVRLRRVVKENYSPTLCNSTPRDPEQNSWKQRTPVLEGGWDSYWVEIVAPQIATCSPNSDKRLYKRNLSQGRPPRFDQYLLHLLEYGSNEILCLLADYLDFEGQGFLHIMSRHRFQFLANPWTHRRTI